MTLRSQLVTDLPNDDILIEIYDDDIIFAEVSNLDGERRVRIFGESGEPYWSFPLKDLLQSLEKATKR